MYKEQNILLENVEKFFGIFSILQLLGCLTLRFTMM